MTMYMSSMNHTNQLNGTDQIGGIAYLLANLAVYMPYTVLYSIASVCGIMGNLLIFATIILNKELHNTTSMLMFNLSLADIIVSGFVDSFTVAGVLVGQNFFLRNPLICGFIASFCLIACITSLMNIGFLAFNRFIHICYHHHYAAMFTVKKTIVYCMITWLIGCLITVPNLAGWGGYRYDTKTLECLWNRLASHSYSIFFPMSSIIVPCLCILFFYLRIFLYVYQSKRRVNHASAITSHSRSREFTKSIKIAKGLFTSFMLFTICWLPYGMIVMIDFGDRLPPAAHAYSMAIAHFNSAFNPVLYAVANPAFQKGYKKLFSKLVFKLEISRSHKSQVPVEHSINTITLPMTQNRKLTIKC